MPKLDELPVELLAHVVLFTNERRVYNRIPNFPLTYASCSRCDAHHAPANTRSVGPRGSTEP
jgi:hypothetical protein